MAMTSSQKGVLWWASHHRTHHRYSDREGDLHSPLKGFFWSHCGWFLAADHESYPAGQVKDLSRYPELVWLERNWAVPVMIYALVIFLCFGWSGLFWGVGVSTVLLWHGTFTINSLAHVWGSQRYETNDDSRNHPVLALITLGEGWHNNHHRYPSSARNGFFWWEFDVTYSIIRVLSLLGFVSQLRKAPIHGGPKETEPQWPEKIITLP